MFRRIFLSTRSLVSPEVLNRNMSGLKPKQFKVFLTRRDMPGGCVSLLESNNCHVTLSGKLQATRNDLLESVKGVDAIYCCLNDKINKELLDAAGPNLKVVSTISVGVDHIDLEECKKRGVRVGSTPDVLTDATAELTLALLLATSRRLPEAMKEARNGGWVSWAPTWMTGPGLKDSTVGIVGFGRIGQAVARRVKAFNTAKILYYNRSQRPEETETGAVKVDFNTILRESDFIICCVALAPETKEIFNAEAFKQMKPTAIFINTSRGGTVNQEALIDALQSNTIRAAGLDVTTPEPLPLDSKLFSMENCVVLPHIGSAAIETRDIMGAMTAQNIIAALKGETMPAEVKF